MSELAGAIEVFVTALAKIKSQYHPYLCDRVGSLYVLHDAPVRKDPRKTEVIVSGVSPSQAAEEIRNADLGWHFLCDIYSDPASGDKVRSQYKSLGYRALGTEWMFVHDLRAVPTFESDPPVRRVESQAEADGIPQLGKHKLKLMNGSRDYRIWDENRDYGFVRSVDIGESSWVQGLYVHSDVRRCGFGKALMSSLLQDDKALGRKSSVLLASRSGATVYPLLGYRQIGVLQMFCPVKRSA